MAISRHTIRHADTEDTWMFDVLICSKNIEHVLNSSKNTAHTYEMSVLNNKYLRIQHIIDVIDVEDMYNLLNIHVRLG